ncbi:MAG: nickel pincer cofactor biosynthesis protein LarB [bacterium]
MHEEHLKELLKRVSTGQTGIDEALKSLRNLPYENLDFARIDHSRQLRTGVPEVIFCPGKQPRQVAEIVKRMTRVGSCVLATRADRAVYEQVKEAEPSARYHELARAITVRRKKESEPYGQVLILSAGTSDMPVAEEARVTVEMLGSKVKTIYDVGVAGIHRLLDQQESLAQARVIVVVAGMEGALASVAAGLVSCPVVAVPTSIGYGASFGGVAALLGMLNSCATGVSVVNIDNGFGAGYTAHKINIVGRP